MTDNMGRSNGDEYNPFEISLDALLAAAAHEPPPLDEDPTARLLGLLPDPTRPLDGAALKTARQVSGLSVSVLAQRLSMRGWAVKASDVFRWENRSTSDVVPALTAAIAVEVNAPIRRLEREAEAGDRFASIRESPRFKGLVGRWADLFSLSQSSAALGLENRALATVHRGEQPDDEQTLDTLEVLLGEMERKTKR